MGIQGEPNAPVLVALLGGAHKVLTPVLDPFHRPRKQPRAVGDDDLLGVGEELRPETATHIGRDHPHLTVFQVQHLKQRPLDSVWRLSSRPHGEGVDRGVVAREHCASLQRATGAAMLLVGLGDHVGCVGEGAVHVPVFARELGSKIVGRLQLRRWRIGREGIAAVH